MNDEKFNLLLIIIVKLNKLKINILIQYFFIAIKWVKSLDVNYLLNSGQRKGKPGSVYRTPKSKRIAPPRYRNLDFA